MADFAAGHLDIGVAAGDEDGQAWGEAGGQLGWIVAVGLGQEQRRRGTEDSGQDGRQARWYGAGRPEVGDSSGERVLDGAGLLGADLAGPLRGGDLRIDLVGDGVEVADAKRLEEPEGVDGRGRPGRADGEQQGEQRAFAMADDAQPVAVDAGLPGQESQRGRGLLLERADADGAGPAGVRAEPSAAAAELVVAEAGDSVGRQPVRDGLEGVDRSGEQRGVAVAVGWAAAGDEQDGLPPRDGLARG